MEPLLTIIRFGFDDERTLGSIVTNQGDAFTSLEDTDRGLESAMPAATIASRKVAEKTAIPCGRYRLVWAWSPTQKRYTPRLLDVPGFEGILIHRGNWARDSAGCPLVGSGFLPGGAGIAESQKAEGRLFPLVQTACAAGEQWCLVRRDPIAWQQRLSAHPALSWSPP